MEGVLRSLDKTAIKDLIEKNPAKTAKLLHMINLAGVDSVAERRSLNTAFMDSLLELEQTRPATYLWLKQNVDYEICSAVLSDWKYTG
jgi:hypothetical protein